MHLLPRLPTAADQGMLPASSRRLACVLAVATGLLAMALWLGPAAVQQVWVQPAVASAVATRAVPVHIPPPSHLVAPQAKAVGFFPDRVDRSDEAASVVSDTVPTLSAAPRDNLDLPAEGAPLWAHLVTPVAQLLLCGVAVARMAQHGQWPSLGGPAPAAELQLRASAGMRSRGGDYGRPKPTLLQVLLGHLRSLGGWVMGVVNGFIRWFRGSPIEVVMILIFLCSWALWINPGLEPLFLVQGFRNPLAFVFSGFACFNIYQLYTDIFYVYILGKAYCVEFSPRELAVLFGGGTFMGSLLVALTPGGWMGPAAGTAALLTAFMLRYPTTPMAIPMIPLIFFPFQVRWIGTILAAVNFYLWSKGVASGAAFTGGVLFALLLKPRKELSLQDTSLSV
eukprot:EG_transcript_13308